MLRTITRITASCRTKNSLDFLSWTAWNVQSNRQDHNTRIPLQSSHLHSRCIHNAQVLHKKSQVGVVLLMSDGRRLEVQGNEGDSILDVIINNHIDIKGFGACEGTVSCSTCHVMFSPEDFKRLNTMAVEEEDVLDMAEDVTPCSRLGCQVVLSKELAGLEVKVPEKVKDIRHSEDDDAIAK